MGNLWLTLTEAFIADLRNLVDLSNCRSRVEKISLGQRSNTHTHTRPVDQ